MISPRFTIVIPTLNEEKFLPNLLRSLVAQTDKNFETIVVDGKSDDNTIPAANKFKKILPNLTVAPCLRGVSRQRNAGARMAKADWIIFADADSVLMPQFIERISLFIKEKKPDCFTTWFRSDIDNGAYAILGLIMNISIEVMALTKKPWIPGPLSLIRRDVFRTIGGYNEEVTYAEDHEIGVNLTKHGMRLEVLREILYIYSFRRFKKEGLLKIINRTIKSTTLIAFTNQGLKTMPGFIGGGSLYSKKPKKKRVRLISKELEQSIKRFVQELLK